MMKTFFYSLWLFGLVGCIGSDIIDDAVPPRVVIVSPIDTLEVGKMYSFSAKYLDESGREAPSTIEWLSTNESVVSINENGLATGLMVGSTSIIAKNEITADTVLLVCDENVTSGPTDLRTATLTSVSSYPLDGSVTLKEESNGDLYLRFSSDFNTTSALPGLYVYLSNNVNSKADAYEVDAVKQFTGSQEYLLDGSVSIGEFDYVLFYCKPFNVPVGNGEFKP